MKKIFIAFLITLILGSGVAWGYQDVPENSPYFYAVEFLRRAEVISDKTTTFKPDLVITRAEFIRYLVDLNNRDFNPKSTAKLPFKDTRDTAWYASYFEEAINLGILSDRETEVRPYAKLRLHEAVELLFHSRSIPIPKRKVGTSIFKDAERNPKLAALMLRAFEMELFEPTKNDFMGTYRPVTKGEAAQLIYQMEIATLNTPIPGNQQTFKKAEEQDFKLNKILTAWKLLHKNFVDPEKLNASKLSDEAIRAMMKLLDDPYSVYLDEVENASFSDDLDGQIEGIGAMVGFNETKEITIITPLADSPAERAGLKSGDIIRLVDGVDLKGMSLEKAVSLIKGPKGTAVVIQIEREGVRRDFSIVRDVIQIKSLEYKTKEDGRVMVVHLLQFSQNAPAEFAAVMKTIQETPAIQGLVLDLRDNPGGLLDVAIRILNHFLKREVVAVKIKYNNFSFTQHATGGGEMEDFPMVVLINKGSASASEIVAGALKDYKIAPVIGEKSFGKGTVQELNQFKDNSSLKLTVAKWLTPLGHDIQGNGITPDIPIPSPTNGDKTQDPQLERALEELRTLMNAR